MELQNTGGMSAEDFAAARDRLLGAATANPKLASVRLSELPDVASLKVDVDQQRLAALGLSAGDVNSTISTAWGGRYVNDFIDRGRVKRVYVQGDAPYRASPADIDQWFVRSNQGSMVPFSSFARTEWMPLVGETAFSEEREAGDEERKRRDEEEKLQEPLAKARPAEIFRVRFPVERLLAIVEGVLRLAAAL